LNGPTIGDVFTVGAVYVHWRQYDSLAPTFTPAAEVVLIPVLPTKVDKVLVVYSAVPHVVDVDV